MLVCLGMKAAVVALLLASRVLAPTLAHADPVRVATVVVDGPPGSDNEVPQASIDQPPVEHLTGVARQSQIVGSERGLVMGTALTVPEGHVELTARTAVLVSGVMVAGGLTSTTELWADANVVLPIEDGDSTTVYGVGIKQVLGRGRNWQLAATGSLRAANDHGDHARFATVGGVLTMCSDDCSLMFDAGLSVVMIESEKATPLIVLGASAGGPRARLLAELLRAQNATDAGSMLFFGVRFGGSKTSVDLGLMKVLDQSDAVLPLLSLQTRM